MVAVSKSYRLQTGFKNLGELDELFRQELKAGDEWLKNLVLKVEVGQELLPRETEVGEVAKLQYFNDRKSGATASSAQKVEEFLELLARLARSILRGVPRLRRRRILPELDGQV